MIYLRAANTSAPRAPAGRQGRTIAPALLAVLLAVAWMFVQTSIVRAQSGEATPAPAAGPPAPGQPVAPPDEPVALGAWLWQANCVRCHGAYGADRVGDTQSAKVLQEQISGTARDGCTVKWAITRGGPLRVAEIRALVAYIEAWEAAGAEPAMAPLPPIPTATLRSTATPADRNKTATPAPTAVATLPPAVADALATNPVAQGAWLYAENCVLCHMGYATARQAALLDDLTIHKYVTEGKMGTSMPPFSMLKGGALRAAQIDAIVLYMRTWEERGGPPLLPDVVQERLDARTAAALALATPTPVAAPAAVRLAPPAGEASTRPARGLKETTIVFLQMLCLGSLGGMALLMGAVICTALVPPKRPPEPK